MGKRTNGLCGKLVKYTKFIENVFVSNIQLTTIILEAARAKRKKNDRNWQKKKPPRITKLNQPNQQKLGYAFQNEKPNWTEKKYTHTHIHQNKMRKTNNLFINFGHGFITLHHGRSPWQNYYHIYFFSQLIFMFVFILYLDIFFLFTFFDWCWLRANIGNTLDVVFN